VDIYRKPGYDLLELLVDSAIRWPQLKVAHRLLKKKLGFRYLRDLIPLDCSLVQVKGSHGTLVRDSVDAPLVVTRQPHLLPNSSLEAREIHDVNLTHLCGESRQAQRAS
jgi:hypothetical protein